MIVDSPILLWLADYGGPWVWYALGLILLGLEVVAPGMFLMWFGIAALSVGTFAFLVPVSVPLQVALFAFLSLVSVIVGRMIMIRLSADETPDFFQGRGERFVGQVYRLDEPIVTGRGRLKVGDSIWQISGTDLPAGRHVRVTGADGSRLIVEPEGDFSGSATDQSGDAGGAGGN